MESVTFGSVEKALAKVGGAPVLTGDPDVIARADKIVLPGVGAFCATMTNLNASGLREPTLDAIRQGKPFLGICVGMQMLFETSREMGRDRRHRPLCRSGREVF